MSVRIFCDVCKKEITSLVYYLSISPVDVTTIYLNKHLCDECIKDLENYFIEKEAEANE